MNMEDLLYERKFDEMQIYIPFLQKVIDKLRSNEQDKPRQAQLQKMEMLHDLLTNKQKKLKIETLLKCECVLKKLHTKIERQYGLSQCEDDNKRIEDKTDEFPMGLSSSSSSNANSIFAASSKSFGEDMFKKNTRTISPPASPVPSPPASPSDTGCDALNNYDPPVEIPTERYNSPPPSSREHRDRHMNSMDTSQFNRRSRWDCTVDDRHTHGSSHRYHDRNGSDNRNLSNNRKNDGSRSSRLNDSPPPPPSMHLPNSYAKKSTTRRYEEGNSSSPSSSNRHNRFNYDNSRRNFDESASSRGHQRSNTRDNSSPIDIDSKTYHDTIYKWKKPNTENSHNPNASNKSHEIPKTMYQEERNVFNRLGEKLDKPSSVFTNFKIQVKNDKLKGDNNSSNSGKIFNSSSIPMKSSTKFDKSKLISNVAKATPIADVLRSPPLSANDLVDLLSDSSGDVSIIGTRRNDSPLAFSLKSSNSHLKNDENKSESPRERTDSPSNLDAVRKKLALVSKNNNNSAVQQKTTNNVENKTPAAAPSRETERLALKYNPRPRKEKSSLSNDIDPDKSSIDTCSRKYFSPQSPPPPQPSTQNSIINHFPTINTFDPRLKRSTPSANIASNSANLLPKSAALLPTPTALLPTPILPLLNFFPATTTSPQNLLNPSIVPPPKIPSLFDLTIEKPTDFDRRIDLESPRSSSPLSRSNHGKSVQKNKDMNYQSNRQQHSNQSLYSSKTSKQSDSRPTNSKFDALRNDKTERMKYIESKKMKSVEPKTYAEYRKIKYQTTLADETKEKYENREKSKTAATDDDNKSTIDISSPAPDGNYAAKGSNLDKMYRNSDYAKVELPKTTTFKIPKKHKEVEEEPAALQAKESIKDTKSKTSIEENTSKSTNNKGTKSSSNDKSIENKSRKSDTDKPTEASISKTKATRNSIESINELETKCEGSRRDPAIELSKENANNDRSSSDWQVIDEIGIVDGGLETTVNFINQEISEKEKQEKIMNSETTLSNENQSTKPQAAGKIRNRRKSYADNLYHETDDSCNVSTQNIIEGKRRSRPVINFNEKQTPATPSKKKANETSQIDDLPASNVTLNKSKTATDKEQTEEEAIKKTPSAAPAPSKVKRKKAAPVKRNNKKGKTRINSKETMTTPTTTTKTTMEDGQICAVSSTTSQQDDASSNIPCKQQLQDNIPDSIEEPSSSDKPDALIEGFFQGFADPSNHQRMFDLLKTVLDENVYQQVKTIIEGTNKNALQDATDIDPLNPEVVDCIAKESPAPSPSTCGAGGGESKNSGKMAVAASKKFVRKKTELDRLNEDIRDMFISKGVLTATGRRMCTLVSSSAENTTAATTPAAATTTTTAKSKTQMTNKKQQSTTPMKIQQFNIRKSKVIISPLNIRRLRSRQTSNQDESDSENQSDEDEEQKCEAEMPLLKPNTPPEIPEEDNLFIEDRKTTKYQKPCPKSKRQKISDNTSNHEEVVTGDNADNDNADDDDDYDEMQLQDLKVKIKEEFNTIAMPLSVKKRKIREMLGLKNDNDGDNGNKQPPGDSHVKKLTNKLIKNEKKILKSKSMPSPIVVKEEVITKNSSSLDDEKEPESVDNDDDMLLLRPKPLPDIILNTNRDWHSQSNYANVCVICNKKQRYISLHYLTVHRGSEVYISRLPPPILTHFRENKSNRPDYCVSGKNRSYHYNCPFCQIQSTNAIRFWMEHIRVHTGEYCFQCSECYKGFNGSSSASSHALQCAKSKIIPCRRIQTKSPNTIIGFVCHLCDYIQICRKNLNFHYKNHHGKTEMEASTLGYQIKILDGDDVPCIDRPTAAIMAAAKNAADLEEQRKNVELIREQINLENNETQKSNNTLNNVPTLDVAIDESNNSNNVENNNSNVKNSQNNTNNNNWKHIFMSRDVASPTLDGFTERLRSIEQDETNVTIGSTGNTKNITIAERLSQRFKNLEKSAATEIAASSSSFTTIDQNENNSEGQKECSEITVGDLPSANDETTNIPPDNSDQSENKQTQIDNSNDKNKETSSGNDDDNDDNWEDIEIVETAPLSGSGSGGSGGSTSTAKEKTKSKSIFQTMSRLFASVKSAKPKKAAAKQQTKTIASKYPQSTDSSEKNNVMSTESNPVPVINSEQSLDSCSSKSSSLQPQIVTVESLSNQQTSTENSQPKIISVESLCTQESSNEIDSNSNSGLHQPQIVSVESLANFTDLLSDECIDSIASLEPMEDIDFSTLLDSNFSSIDSASGSPSSILAHITDTSLFPFSDVQLTDATEVDCQEVTNSEVVTSQKNQQQQQQQQQKLPTKTNAKINQITNLGFFKDGGKKLKFYCMVDACTFLYSDEMEGLENHFLLEHSTLHWSGYCQTCKLQVLSSETHPIALEMKHLKDVHITSSDVSDPLSENRPRIKLRRLSGDKLSNSPVPTSFQSAVFETTLRDLMQNEANIVTSPHPNVSTVADTTTASLENKDNSSEVALFKNVSKDFAITAVASGIASENLPATTLEKSIENPNSSYSNELQITSVFSLGTTEDSLSKKSQFPSGSMSCRRESISANFEIVEIESEPEPEIEHETTDDSQNPLMISNNIENQPSATSSASTTTTKTTAILNSTANNSRPNFQCMAVGCKYTTRVPVAMSEHLRLHERRNIASTNCDWLRCSQCTYIADSVSDYLRHFEIGQHVQTNATSQTSSSSTSESSTNLVQKIQNILRNSKGSHSTDTPYEDPLEKFYEKLQQVAREIVIDTGIDEASLYRCAYQKCKAVLSENTFHTHLMFHLTTTETGNSPITNIFKCPHCQSVYLRPSGIKAHLRCHGRHRYFCYLCTTTTANVGQIQKHFNEKHWKISALSTQPLIPGEVENDQTFYVTNDVKLSEQQIKEFGEKLICEWEQKRNALKKYFHPNEISMLPIQPIFNNEIFCSVCNYKTKVRTNMLRHLQMMHKNAESKTSTTVVASVDPVNPVPCLNSNERHFDRMLNLACSSNSGSSNITPAPSSSSATATTTTKKIPNYVPESKRFICGVNGCQYLTITETIFRQHLNALHNDEQHYLCPHCHEEICKKGLSLDQIFHHLRFHCAKLYQCEKCDYYHHIRYVVKRHILEKHPTHQVKLFSHDREIGRDTVTQFTMIVGKKYNATNNSTSTTTTTTTSTSSGGGGSEIGKKNSNKKKDTSDSKLSAIENDLVGSSNSNDINTSTSFSPASNNVNLKWECNICKHRTVTWNQMISHVCAKHNLKHQYHCVHCPFGASQINSIMNHIDTKHPAKTRETKYIFHKITEMDVKKQPDTRPLWSRDDPKRVRHIRGILMENEDEAEAIRKNLQFDSDNDDDDNNNDDHDDNDENESGGCGGGDSETLKIDVENVANDEFFKIFTFGCFYCDNCELNFKSLDQVKEHWKLMHFPTTKNRANMKRISMPFFYRLHSKLKCFQCSTFVGNHLQMQSHLQNVHNVRHNHSAIDPFESNCCGYCTFSYNSIEMLNKHCRESHKPIDLKNFNENHLKKVLSFGEIQTHFQCQLCGLICVDKDKVLEHINSKHSNDEQQTITKWKEIHNEIIYRCSLCLFTSTDEYCTLRHMIDHYARFKRCQFCADLQPNFNSYMQHCYNEHRNEIKRFERIYTFQQIKKFLDQMLVIFPNGLAVDKKNLWQTPYGCENLIKIIYKEICKIAQEPPIPRLSIARLVARKSIEASSSDSLPSVSTPVAVTKPIAAQRITKRRSTVALAGNETTSCHDKFLSIDHDRFIPPSVPSKKRKLNDILTIPPPPLFSNCSSSSSSGDGNHSIQNKKNLIISESITKNHQSTVAELEPYSFYGKKSETLDLSKIYTNISIGGSEASISCSKFALLFQINAYVQVEKLDAEKCVKLSKKIIKPCPASKKFQYL